MTPLRQAGLTVRGLGRCLVLLGLVASGLWCDLAGQLEALVARLERDLRAPSPVPPVPGLSHALRAVDLLRAALGLGIGMGGPPARAHRRAALGVDRWLEGWRGRL